MKIKREYSKANSLTAVGLLRAFKEAGITCTAKETLYKWEREGRITLDRQPPTPRRKLGARVIFPKQLPQILKAFLPGGTGYWHTDGHKGFKKPVKRINKLVINDYLNKHD